MIGQFDKVRRFLGALGKQNAIIGKDRHRHSVNMGKAAHQRFAIEFFELVKLRSIHQPRNHFACIIWLFRVGRHQPVKLFDVVDRLSRLSQFQRLGLRPVERPHRAAHNRQGVIIMGGIMVDDTGFARMNIRSAQILGRDHFTGCRFDQRRTAQKDRALLAHDNGFIRHGRHISAARRTRPHHRRDLRNAHRAHIRLIVEDPSEVLAVGKNLGLMRQVRAATVHQVQAWQMVLHGDFLRPQMLLHGHRVVCPALHRRIIANDHTFATLDTANTGNHPRAGGGVIIHAIGRQRANLQKRCPGIKQPFNPFAR